MLSLCRHEYVNQASGEIIWLNDCCMTYMTSWTVKHNFCYKSHLHPALSLHASENGPSFTSVFCYRKDTSVIDKEPSCSPRGEDACSGNIAHSMLQEYYYCSFLNIQVAFCWEVHHQTKQSYKGADVAIWSPFDIFFLRRHL